MSMQADDEYVPPDGWIFVDIERFKDAPFKVYINDFKSGSDRLNALIKDPLGFMTGQVFGEEFGGITGEKLEGVREDTRISTWITNHQNTLLHMVLYGTALVSTDENSVYLTLYKKDGGS